MTRSFTLCEARRRRPRRGGRGLGVLMVAAITAVTGAARADAPPTLDALLGLDEPSTSAPAASSSDSAVDRQRLTETAPNDLMRLALSRMTQAADQLSDQSVAEGRAGRPADALVPTRRLQREAVDALDALIAQLSRQTPQRDKSAGAAGSSGQPRQADTGSQANAPRTPGAAGAAAASSADGSEGHSGQASPGSVTAGGPEGALEQADAAGRAWGNLPAQIRGELSQGVTDPFSAVYQRLTEAYYQRLARQGDDIQDDHVQEDHVRNDGAGHPAPIHGEPQP